MKHVTSATNKYIPHPTSKKTPPTMAKTSLAFLLTCLWSLARLSAAADADNLYDLCPTDAARSQKFFFNGFPCKPAPNVTASDFKSSLLSRPGEADILYRSSTTMATAAEFPGLNTLGLSGARTDIEVDGAVAPHAHPRASEVMFVRSGTVGAGFVDSSNRVFQKRVREGEAFVFPKGLLHFCFNAGFEDATVFSVLNSQNPGAASIAGAMFGGGNGMEMVERMKSLQSTMGDLDGVSIVELFGK